MEEGARRRGKWAEGQMWARRRFPPLTRWARMRGRDAGGLGVEPEEGGGEESGGGDGDAEEGLDEGGVARQGWLVLWKFQQGETLGGVGA